MHKTVKNTSSSFKTDTAYKTCGWIPVWTRH